MSDVSKDNEILKVLMEINNKVDKLLVQNMPEIGRDDTLPESLDVMTLLSLPDHLRTTATALLELKHATADELSKKTHKERAVESSYLNQLVRMGYVSKFRKGRNVYFSIGEGLNR